MRNERRTPGWGRAVGAGGGWGEGGLDGQRQKKREPLEQSQQLPNRKLSRSSDAPDLSPAVRDAPRTTSSADSSDDALDQSGGAAGGI